MERGSGTGAGGFKGSHLAMKSMYSSSLKTLGSKSPNRAGGIVGPRVALARCRMPTLGGHMKSASAVDTPWAKLATIARLAQPRKVIRCGTRFNILFRRLGQHDADLPPQPLLEHSLVEGDRRHVGARHLRVGLPAALLECALKGTAAAVAAAADEHDVTARPEC
eukprot:scaffold228516_cov40-Tisochrysis_lutea.AAC.1